MKLCDYHQFVLTSALDKQPAKLPWLTRRHLHTCQECQGLWSELQHLHGQLQEKGGDILRAAQKDPLGLPLPPLFRQKPKRSISQNGRRFHLGWRPLLGLAAAMLIVLVGVRLYTPVPVIDGPKVSQLLPQMKDRLAILTQDLSKTSLEDPMQRELDGLLGSAKSAAEFLRSKVKAATDLSENGG